MLEKSPAEQLIPKRHYVAKIIGTCFLLYLVSLCSLMWWWDKEPKSWNVRTQAELVTQEQKAQVVVGSTTTASLISVIDTLLNKRGGYLANDIAPPGLLMDNIPSWEEGAILQVRDLALALRNDFSRSQSQSVEDADLREALNYLSANRKKWIFPSTENQLRQGKKQLIRYLIRLSDENADDAQFYARADNLANYFALVEKRLGSLSQQLSASIGQERLDTALAGDLNAQQSTPKSSLNWVKTPWSKIDNVFYEARGTTWTLSIFLKAIEIDFAPVLRDKNALISLQQIIRELDEAQAAINSPIILNGSAYGLFANHSLVIANYISRANAAMIDLRKLLERG
jgi:hypothetical protein